MKREKPAFVYLYLIQIIYIPKNIGIKTRIGFNSVSRLYSELDILDRVVPIVETPTHVGTYVPGSIDKSCRHEDDDDEDVDNGRDGKLSSCSGARTFSRRERKKNFLSCD